MTAPRMVDCEDLLDYIERNVSSSLAVQELSSMQSRSVIVFHSSYGSRYDDHGVYRFRITCHGTCDLTHHSSKGRKFKQSFPANECMTASACCPIRGIVCKQHRLRMFDTTSCLQMDVMMVRNETNESRGGENGTMYDITSTYTPSCKH